MTRRGKSKKRTFDDMEEANQSNRQAAVPGANGSKRRHQNDASPHLNGNPPSSEPDTKIGINSTSKPKSEIQREQNRLRQQRRRQKKAALKRQELGAGGQDDQAAGGKHDPRDCSASRKSKNNNQVEDKHQARSVKSAKMINTILQWPSDAMAVPLHQEQKMVEVLMERHGPEERGMLKDKPEFVLQKFHSAMRRHAPAMSMDQLCSLRRHHIKLLNPSRDMTSLRLGKEEDIRKSSTLFEQAVHRYLKQEKIPFQTEAHLVASLKRNKQPLQATPDFIFPTQPITLRKTRQGEVLEEATDIRWLEVKMFYGASTIPHGSNGAVGTVLAKAQKYTKHFGPGAVLFMMGCGEQLETELKQSGVMVLDCCGHTSPIDLRQVRNHQQTWCANSKGEILP